MIPPQQHDDLKKAQRGLRPTLCFLKPSSILNWSFHVYGCSRLRVAFRASRRHALFRNLRGVLHLIWFCMQLSVMNLVTIRRERMILVFFHAHLRHFGDLVGGRRGRIGRVGDTGCECRRGHHGGREQNGRNFPVHVFFLRGIWLIEIGPKRSCDYLYAARCEGGLSAVVRCHSST
jgi:hypothetical protein